MQRSVGILDQGGIAEPDGRVVDREFGKGKEKEAVEVPIPAAAKMYADHRREGFWRVY
jgi:hypothetical protein